MYFCLVVIVLLRVLPCMIINTFLFKCVCTYVATYTVIFPCILIYIHIYVYIHTRAQFNVQSKNIFCANWSYALMLTICKEIVSEQKTSVHIIYSYVVGVNIKHFMFCPYDKNICLQLN